MFRFPPKQTGSTIIYFYFFKHFSESVDRLISTHYYQVQFEVADARECFTCLPYLQENVLNDLLSEVCVLDYPLFLGVQEALQLVEKLREC